MNFISATYLISSDKKFSPEDKFSSYIKELFGEGKFSPKISEAEYMYDEDSGLHKGLIKVDFPIVIFKHNIASILTLLYGELVVPENVKLIDIEFPPAFLDHFSGPNFGIDGIRYILNIKHRPLVSIPLKYTNGVEKEDFVTLLKSVIEGNPDIIREDELFLDDSYIPFEERINSVCRILDNYSKNIIYAPLLHGNIVEIADKIDFASKKGIKAFLLNLFPIGIENLYFLSKKYKVAFLINPGYPPFFYEKDQFGIEPSLFFGKILRLAGADMIFIPSPFRHKIVPHYRSVEIANSLLESFENINKSFPVIYGGVSEKELYNIFSDFGSQVIIDTEIPFYSADVITEKVISLMDTVKSINR